MFWHILQGQYHTDDKCRRDGKAGNSSAFLSSIFKSGWLNILNIFIILTSRFPSKSVSLWGSKKLLHCHQSGKYQLIFSWWRSGVLGATTIDSQGALVFYENSYLWGMWPLSSKLTMPRSDLRALEWQLDASRWMTSFHVNPLCVWEPVQRTKSRNKQKEGFLSNAVKAIMLTVKFLKWSFGF